MGSQVEHYLPQIASTDWLHLRCLCAVLQGNSASTTPGNWKFNFRQLSAVNGREPNWRKTMENTPISRFDGKHRFLSNFYHAPLTVIGIPYLNSEAAYNACKTLDVEVRTQFSTLDPSAAKKLGRRVKMRDNWDEITKVECMELCLWAKFGGNPSLKEQLLATGERELIEGNNWNDKFWGVCNGQGQNILGKLLMEIRKRIQ
jgi:ribA/ribD-fused uncharacterized protein